MTLEAFFGSGSTPLVLMSSCRIGAPGFIEDVRRAGRKHLLQSFTFQPVSDLIFVMRALSGLYWILRSLKAVVPVWAVLAAHGLKVRHATG